MKKLKRFVLNPSCHSLDIGVMTGIVGGFSARSTSCGTSCGSYPSIYITNCNGDCFTKEGQYAVCVGPTREEWKYCE